MRQLLAHADVPLELAGLRVRDWPYKPLRGVKLYLPGRENIAFFKRFVSDFLALSLNRCRRRPRRLDQTVGAGFT